MTGDSILQRTDIEMLLAESVVFDAERQIRKLYTKRDEAVNAIVKARLGLELPIIETFRDEDGTLWAINVFASLRKVEAAMPQEER